MPYHLIKPHPKYATDFRQMCAECLTSPRPDYGKWDTSFSALLKTTDLDDFDDKIVTPLLDIENGRLARYWNVPTEQMWFINTHNHFVGFADIRHKLIPQNKNSGGNIGFFLRPSARGQGIGKHLLRAALAYASTLGLQTTTLCCHPLNIASQKTIETIMHEMGGSPLPDGLHNGTWNKRFCLNTQNAK